jgi:hypothetical protein
MASIFFSNGIQGPSAQVGQVYFMQFRQKLPNSSIGRIALMWRTLLQWPQVAVSVS